MNRLSIVVLTGGLCLLTGAAFADPGMIINEILYDPAPDLSGDANKDTVVDTSQDEFVELVNSSAASIDLSGWTLSDGTATRHTFPPGTMVGAGCAIVVFGGGHPPINLFGGAVVQVASTGLLGLNNNGDAVTLRDASAAIVATHIYPDAGNVDQSITRDPDITGSDTFVLHSLATGSGGSLFSPGTHIDGSPFGACVPPGPDADGDGHPDDVDNCPNLANPDQADCNGNGIGDACEIIKDPSLDCNNNGILDVCEPDCNNSGFPDDCDVLFGISQDCNNNLIPDECEPDCNGNSIPDDCDILNGTSLDANLNGVPDECENVANVVINEILAGPPPGAAGDANGDGTPNATQDEFVEIVNISGGPVNISGWTLRDTLQVRHTFPTGTILPDQCGIVVFGGGTPVGQFGGCQKQVASTGTLSLNNDGDTVTLRDASSLLVDEHTYGVEGGDDQSLTRSPDLTGDFVKHTVAQPGVPFSPGQRTNLTVFGGCPPVLPDADGDGVPDINDNCPNTVNPLQQDCDGDGIGDACETDPDSNGNGIPDNCEIVVPGNVRINEIRIDQPGTDNDEYFEIKGPPSLSLNGLTYLVIGDGSAGSPSGVIESVTSLNGHSIPADGYFLTVEPTFTLAPPSQRDFVVPGTNGLNFENSDNVTHLLVTNFSGTNGQDLDTDDNGVLDILPWGAVVDAVGLVGTGVPGTPGVEYAYGASLGFVDVGPDATFVPGQIFRCETAGTWNIGKFDPFDISGGTDTPGVAGPPCATPPCPPDRNGDNVVNTADLLIIINNWGSNNPVADINGDGIVNTADLLAVINGWGPCPP